MSMWPPVRSALPPAQVRAEIPSGVGGDQKKQETLHLNRVDFLGECVISIANIVPFFFFFLRLSAAHIQSVALLELP